MNNPGWAAKLGESEPPYSFVYGRRPAQELLSGWQVATSSRKLDAKRTERTITRSDPGTGLVVRCVAVEYSDFPTVEWTVYLRNDGKADTPIIEDIQALDARFERGAEGEFTLHHYTGSVCRQDDFAPNAETLGPKSEKRITTSGGRPSYSDWPYFNLEMPGGGVIVVVGWPGQWATKFTRDETNGLQVRAGQELTHFSLHPGEEIRSPLMVLQFWKGDRIRAQNLFRRWMLAHNLPRLAGKLPPPQLNACSSHQYGEMVKADEASQILFIDRYAAEGVKLDYWWMDAGWYPCENWTKTGTWEVDKKRFPGGFRPITDHAHEKGVKIIVWFEPERVAPGTWLWDTHPEWILKGEPWGLLDLGNPEAWKWLIGHVDRLLSEEGVDLYRQDFNINPLSYWRGNDAPDRQGITEIKHVMGYLAYWDELRKRHPDMLIDSCASGGRRNDLETLRRSVPLLRSDYIFEPIGQQAHTYGLSFWVPFYGTGVIATDPYTVRSAMASGFTCAWDMRRTDLDYAGMRKLIGQWRQISPYFTGDYYPLTSYSLANDVWMAWQFDKPEEGMGVIQAFRRAESPYESARFKLGGLDPEARYELTDLDTAEKQTGTGRELAGDGLVVRMGEQPDSRIFVYRRIGL